MKCYGFKVFLFLIIHFFCKGEIKGLLKLERDFKLILDDPSGNSYIENPYIPGIDPGRMEKHYARTSAQDHLLGQCALDAVFSFLWWV